MSLVNNTPNNIAIIRDGNRRWAKKKRRAAIFGHVKGAIRVDEVVDSCLLLGVKTLTLFAFSTENWQRPQKEVRILMNLLIKFLQKKKKKMVAGGIRLRIIGDRTPFSEEMKRVIQSCEEITQKGQSLELVLAINYGSRDEIRRGVLKLCDDIQCGAIKKEGLTEEVFSRYLDTKEFQDPDLLIRSSGEYRLSNFLLWQLSYTELYFCDTLWPDFTREILLDAISEYQKRVRRLGE